MKRKEPIASPSNVYIEGRWWSVDVGATDATDVELRNKSEVLHEESYLQGKTFQQEYPELTRFVKELLVVGSTK